MQEYLIYSCTQMYRFISLRNSGNSASNLTIRTLLALACEHGWSVWQMDVEVASLQSLVDKDVFLEPAPGHDPRDSKTGEAMVYTL